MNELLIDLITEYYKKNMISKYNNNIDIIKISLYNGTDDHSYFNVETIYVFEHQTFVSTEKIYINAYLKSVRKQKLNEICLKSEIN